MPSTIAGLLLKGDNVNTMQTLISQADTMRKPLAQYSQANIDTDQGLIRCYRDYGVYKNGMPTTIRTNWKLNDKRISASTLENILN